MNETTERPRRWTVPIFGEFDMKTGTLLRETGRGMPEPEILHKCGYWTWERANFCTRCGAPLEGAL